MVESAWFLAKLIVFALVRLYLWMKFIFCSHFFGLKKCPVVLLFCLLRYILSEC